MDFQSDEIRLIEEDEEENREVNVVNVFIEVLSGLRHCFCRLRAAIIYIFGQCKSSIYFLLYCGKTRKYSASLRSNRFTRKRHIRKTRNMNFSSLRRKLNPFDKRGKKKAKIEISVDTLDSPPNLKQNESKVPEGEIDPSKHSPDLHYSDPRYFASAVNKKLNVVADVHRNPEEMTCSDLGNGDFKNKHIANNYNVQKKSSPLFRVQDNEGDKASTEKVDKPKVATRKPIIRPAKLIIQPKDEKAVTEVDLAQKLSNVKVNDGKTSDRKSNNSASENVPKQCKPEKQPDISSINITAEKKASKKVFGHSRKEKSSPQKHTSQKKATKLTDATESPAHKTPTKSNEKLCNTTDPMCKTGATPEESTGSSPILDNIESIQQVLMQPTDMTDLEFNADLVTRAFRHSIITERLQAVDQDLEITIQNCLRIGLKRETENSSVSAPIDEKSRVLLELAEREKERGDKPQLKRRITQLGLDAAYIKHECDKIVYSHVHLAKTAKILHEKGNFNDLTTFVKTLKQHFRVVVGYYRRLKEYSDNKDKLVCLTVYQTPVCDHLDSTLNSIAQSVKFYKSWIEETEVKAREVAETRLSQEKQKNEESKAHPHSESQEKVKPTETDKGQDSVPKPSVDPARQASLELSELKKKVGENYEQIQKAVKKSQCQHAARETQSSKQKRESSSNEKAKEPRGNETFECSTSASKGTACQSPRMNNNSPTTTQKQHIANTTTDRPATNTPPKKSWKANRASELRCAAPSGTTPAGRRIIAPINETKARDPKSDKQDAENTYDSTNEEVNNAAFDNNAAGRDVDKRRKSAGADVGEENPQHGRPGGEIGQVEVQTEIGGGDCKYVYKDLDESTGSGLTTSTPKKHGIGRHQEKTPGKTTPKPTSKRSLIGKAKSNANASNVTTDFTEEDEEIVSSFCDGGEGCLDSVDVKDIESDRSSKAAKSKKRLGEPVFQDGGATSESINRSVDCDTTFDTTFNSTYGSNVTGNTTRDMSRDMSDMSRSFTSYIETNNTIDFSSLEVKPGQGNRVNKKKMQAEIKPKKKKTRGIPNQHLEPKPIPKAKSEVIQGSKHDFIANENTSANASNHVSFVDEILEKEEQKSKNKEANQSKVGSKKETSESKAMNYEQWQTLDQRELHMVPDHVHYQGESKLKEVEEMYTVSGSKGKKKKKNEKKKAKAKQKEGGERQSDEEWFM